MSETLPQPLIPNDTDIDGLDGFMLNTDRLMASELWALSTGEEFKAAMALWCRAWKQQPPGSLPSDDRVLAAFSGAGPRWKKVRDMALRGFVKCSDGRLYHSTLCEDVMRAAKKKAERRERTKAATKERQRKRNEQRDVGHDVQRDVQRDVGHDVQRDVQRDVTHDVQRNEVPGTGQDRTGQGNCLGRDDAASEPRRSRKHRLPDDFGLTAERESYLAEVNPGRDAAWELGKFRDYHASKGSAMVDWDAAWRTWCRNSAEFSAGKAVENVVDFRGNL